MSPRDTLSDNIAAEQADNLWVCQPLHECVPISAWPTTSKPSSIMPGKQSTDLRLLTDKHGTLCSGRQLQVHHDS